MEGIELENISIPLIKGEKGDKGDTGLTGAKGDKGDKGDTGAAGTTDYLELSNRPTINNVMVTGQLTSSDLGLQEELTAGSNIQISNGTISATDTTYTAGTNVQISSGVISATDTTYSNATTSQAGLMSASDKTKLDATDTNYAHTLSISLNTTTNELSIGINDKNGTPLDIGAVDLDDAGFITASDYATSDVGGTVKIRESYGLTTGNGVLKALDSSYPTYVTANSQYVISKGTLENVLNRKIGDIDSALDLINGESVGE